MLGAGMRASLPSKATGFRAVCRAAMGWQAEARHERHFGEPRHVERGAGRLIHVTDTLWIRIGIAPQPHGSSSRELRKENYCLEQSMSSSVVQLFPDQPSERHSNQPRWLADFETWWATYPDKVGKGAARKAFEKAIRIASLQDMLVGVERYRRNKPKDRPWCHPSTWLNQERWLDEPAISATEAISNAPALVPISRGTPEFDAWVRAGHKWSLVLYDSRFGSLGGWMFSGRTPEETR